ncbi:MAG TPA: hypothetical protein QGH10_03430, partial [Armatimonadota bacterium]|nr:hypothetical protein [Armatimonadota bacterium]
MDNTTYRSLLHHIQSLLVVDTHEHMATEADFIEGTWDFTHLMSYTGLDLGLAGMSSEPWGGTQSAISQGDSPEEKWERMAPYWPHVRSGCYARAYRRFLQRFFGVDDLNERTAVEVSERISDYQYEGVYDKHLHGEDNIRVMLHMGGCGPHPEPQHFASILYLDSHAGPLTRGELEGSLGREAPATYAEYADALGGIADTAVSNGAVGMKIGMTARRRPLDFVEHDAAEVEASYRYLLEEADGEWLDPA